jgi:endonuclease/exonuclease/phosphatase family metal-dependent hydrolase
MTFNDGDNGYADKQNYNRVAEIINYYAPDIVGMQEVQKAHADGSTSYYAQLLPDYGIVYFDHGYPNETVINGTSEKNNPYGNPILYRKDRFYLIDSGRRWLSATPDVASRVEGSEWTRTYVWAKLQDRRTGEIFVFVNTHIDYVAAAGLEQVKILLDLTSKQFEGFNIIYTADWNFGSGTDSYKYMNSKGYYATETLMANAYKPAGTIDACFVSSGKFVAIDYKYINTHGTYNQSEFHDFISDHPAILTEIALVKRVNQMPLPGDILIEGPFDSEEDIEGFN